jgi:hypothetical protein
MIFHIIFNIVTVAVLTALEEELLLSHKNTGLRLDFQGVMLLSGTSARK